MRATGDREHSEAARPGSRDAYRRLAIEVGMLALLVGLAAVFVASAPS